MNLPMFLPVFSHYGFKAVQIPKWALGEWEKVGADRMKKEVLVMC